MQKYLLMFALWCAMISSVAQTNPKTAPIKNKTVDIACGECQFKMKGKSCDLAIRMDGKTYFVDGKNIDDFGDAHGKHGFCNAVSQAKVSGKIVNGRFKAEAITLLDKTTRN